MDINKALYGHFRNLAENVDFGDSLLLWHITQTIKHIATKPHALTEPQWREVLSAFELRKEQLNERLNEIEDFPLREDSENLVKEITRQRKGPS